MRPGSMTAGKLNYTVLGNSATVNRLSFLAEPKIFRICKKPFFANPESGAFARRFSACADFLSCKFLKFRFLQETLLAARPASRTIGRGAFGGAPTARTARPAADP